MSPPSSFHRVRSPDRPNAVRASFALVVAAGAALLCMDDAARAFVLTGETLALDQRDVRVFNNFTDAAANSNSTADPSFPGWTGAYLALWKSVVEWGSGPHLQGNGDPLQPGGLGSGASNFDPSWQGAAPGVGGPNDNVMSELSGNGAGVLAFCETPTGDGWRIRFYAQPWIWNDQPTNNTSGANQSDLQAIGCHEYGHALGLDHSQDGLATMFASALPDDTIWRTIEADDAAGIQAIYGPRSATKPSVTNYTQLGGGQIRISGANFAASGNSVWFTRANSSVDGEPVKVLGVSSANGTELVVSVPIEAGAGDLLVQNAGVNAENLSNAFPFTPGFDPCFAPSVYGTGKVNSSGLAARITVAGSNSAAANSLVLNLDQAPGNARAVLFYGSSAAQLPFFGGWMLIAQPRFRLAKTTLDPFGGGFVNVPIDPSWIGQTRCFQFWFEDPGGPNGAGTSDAVSMTICP